MKFVMLRDKVVATLSGHTIEFKKDVPTHVPKEAWKEVQAAGAASTEDADEPAMVKPEPVDPEVRKAKVMEAFALLSDENERENFTGNGSPSIDAIYKISDQMLQAKERDALWVEFTQNQGKDG